MAQSDWGKYHVFFDAFREKIRCNFAFVDKLNE